MSRSFGGRLLRPSVTLGDTVIEVDNGAAAVRALTNSAEAVDVVMLDYRLPDSNDLTLLAPSGACRPAVE